MTNFFPVVPTGWTRGDRIEIEKNQNHLLVRRTRSTVNPYSDPTAAIPRDSVAYIYFQTTKELTYWLDWWFA